VPQISFGINETTGVIRTEGKLDHKNLPLYEDTFQIEVSLNRVNTSHLKAKIWEKIEATSTPGERLETPLSMLANETMKETGVTFGVCFG